MEEDQESKKTKDIARDILDAMGISYESINVEEEEGRTTIAIYTKKDSKILIGRSGANLMSLSRILNLIAKRKHGNEVQLFVDVNDYYKENLDMIRKKAIMVAERVRSYQVDMELEPMNPFERRFVHSLFGEGSDIATRSKGVGSERRIVVSIKKEVENGLGD